MTDVENHDALSTKEEKSRKHDDEEKERKRKKKKARAKQRMKDEGKLEDGKEHKKSKKEKKGDKPKDKKLGSVELSDNSSLPPSKDKKDKKQKKNKKDKKEKKDKKDKKEKKKTKDASVVNINPAVVVNEAEVGDDVTISSQDYFDAPKDDGMRLEVSGKATDKLIASSLGSPSISSLIDSTDDSSPSSPPLTPLTRRKTQGLLEIDEEVSAVINSPRAPWELSDD